MELYLLGKPSVLFGESKRFQEVMRICTIFHFFNSNGLRSTNGHNYMPATYLGKIGMARYCLNNISFFSLGLATEVPKLTHYGMV